MLKTSGKVPFRKLKRVKQQTSAHCGPAVLKMLLGYLGIDVSQDALVEAAHVKRKLKKHGMNIHDLGKAVKKLAPEVNFWFKEYATVGELKKIVSTYKFPVGVEWQGEFGAKADEDSGHYSIVVRVDRRSKTMRLADPYIGKDRTFTISEFKKRWWDTNLVTLRPSRQKRKFKDHHMLFVVTSGRRRFPKKIGMKQVKITVLV